MFEVCEVFNDELDGTEEFIEEFEDRSDAIDFARKQRFNCPNSIWVIEIEQGFQKVIST